jgi:MFS family permease
MHPNIATDDTARSTGAGWASTPARFLLISLFWMPISLFWGAMLGQILPVSAEAFAGSEKSGTFLAVITVAGAVCGLIVQFVIGPISDRCTSRYGRRRPFIVAGTLLAIVAMVVFAYADSFIGLVLSFVAIQFFLNVANGPYQALIPDLVPANHQGAASGVMGVMSLVGDAGGPLLAGLMLRHALTYDAKAHAIQNVIWIVAALLVVCMVVTALAVPDYPAKIQTDAAGDARERYRLNVRQNPHFYGLLVSRSFYNLGFYTATGFLFYYVEYSLRAGAHASEAVTNIQMLAIGGAILGTLTAGYISDRISKKTLIYASSAFSMAVGLVFALTSSLPVANMMAFLFGVGLGTFRSVDWAFACNLLPTGGNAAKYMGIWSLSTMIPQVTAPVFGPIADRLNHLYGMGVGYRGAMVAYLVYTIIGVVIISRVRERAAGDA